MLFSKSAEYAIQAMVYLAEKGSDEPTMIGEIAEVYSIPKQFLAKIVQTLVKYRLLTAVRGRKGGVNLARPSGKIYLPEIIQAVDGPPPEEEPCIFGLDECSDEQPCPFHPRWKVIREGINEMLGLDSLEKLAEEVTRKHQAMEKLLQPD